MKYLIVLLTCFSAMAGAQSEYSTSGNLTVIAGQKSLEDRWGAYDSQITTGVMFDIKGRDWPISLVVDHIGSADEHTQNGEDILAVTSELAIGVRKYWDSPDSKVIPFVGAGVSGFFAEQERLLAGTRAKYDEDDTGTGYWVGAGIMWKIKGDFALGLSARYSDGDVTLFGDKLDAGGTMVALTARVLNW
jgi:opacity protein-like surface antigen